MKFRKMLKNRKFHKLNYYLCHYIQSYLRPKRCKVTYKTKLYLLLDSPKLRTEVMKRVNYYNRIYNEFTLSHIIPNNKHCQKTYISNRKSLKNVDMRDAYRFDLDYYLQFFNQASEIVFTMGDVNHIPSVPGVLKSRPILASLTNPNSILLKLCKIRHFHFIKDQIPFDKKENKLVWRGSLHSSKKKHRKLFLQRFIEHPQCDLAQVNNKNEIAYGGFLSIKEQLRNKFILCLEGNDVATNLKWAMSSNSLCFMPKPRYETWFMEGELKAGFHYVELQPNHEDLEEKIAYYSSNIKEAEFIINNANKHTKLFQNKVIEDLTAFLVLEKYFHFSGQLSSEYSAYFT